MIRFVYNVLVVGAGSSLNLVHTHFNELYNSSAILKNITWNSKQFIEVMGNWSTIPADIDSLGDYMLQNLK